MNRLNRFYYFFQRPDVRFTIVTGLVGYSAYQFSGLRGALKLYSKSIQTRTESVREEDVAWIRNQLNRSVNEISSRFGVVTGPKYVGKTTAINSAANSMGGVINIQLADSKNLNLQFTELIKHEISTRKINRAVVWFKWLFRRSPVAIINVDLSKFDQKNKLKELTSAARMLVEDYGFNVLIEIPNSLNTVCLNGPEDVLYMGPISRQSMRKLPEYATLSEMLKEQGNEEIVLAVCGGIPNVLQELNSSIQFSKTKDKQSQVVRTFVMDKINTAKSQINTLVKNNPEVKEALKMFQNQSEIESAEFSKRASKKDAWKFINVFESKMDLSDLFYEVKTKTGSVMLKPCSGALDVALRVGIDNDANFEQIKSMISAQNTSK